MIQFITMTYLIVGNKKENIQHILKTLLTNLWEREVENEDVFNINNPDIHILDGSDMNSIGIEDVKELQKEMMFSPFKEKVQIAYILDSEKLTVQAQNSLLKTLEETSESTVYILITDNERTLLPTILSRCLKLYTNVNEVEEKESEYPDILDLDIVDSFLKIEGIAKEKADTEGFLTDLVKYFQQDLKKKLIDGNGIIEVERNIKEVVLAQKRVKANGNRRLVLENLLLHLVK